MFVLYFFLLGLIIGSFLNVLILRYHTGVSVVWDRSACFSCGKVLTWKELVPVVSFLVQKGRCASCKSRISWQYPAVELLTGIVFASIAYKIPLELSLFGVVHFFTLLVIAALFIVIVVYDIKHKIIPDVFVFLLIIIGFISLFVGSDGGIMLPTMSAILAGPLLALPFAFLWLISRGKWMGLGDAEIALAMGWLLGLSYGAMALFFSFIIGAVFGIALIATGKFLTLFKGAERFTIKSELPFGPFMALSVWIVWFFGIPFSYVFPLFS